MTSRVMLSSHWWRAALLGGLAISLISGWFQGNLGVVGRLAHSLILWIVLTALVALAHHRARRIAATSVAAAGFVLAYYVGWLARGSGPSDLALKTAYWVVVAAAVGALLGLLISEAESRTWVRQFGAGVLVGALWGDVTNTYRGRPVLPSFDLFFAAIQANWLLTTLAIAGTVVVGFWLSRSQEAVNLRGLPLTTAGLAVGWIGVSVPTVVFDLL